MVAQNILFNTSELQLKMVKVINLMLCAIFHKKNGGGIYVCLYSYEIFLNEYLIDVEQLTPKGKEYARLENIGDFKCIPFLLIKFWATLPLTSSKTKCPRNVVTLQNKWIISNITNTRFRKYLKVVWGKDFFLGTLGIYYLKKKYLNLEKKTEENSWVSFVEQYSPAN